jgi:hypothetical protein
VEYCWKRHNPRIGAARAELRNLDPDRRSSELIRPVDFSFETIPPFFETIPPATKLVGALKDRRPIRHHARSGRVRIAGGCGLPGLNSSNRDKAQAAAAGKR